MPVNDRKLKEFDSHWNEVMDLAKKYGFIIGAYGGAATLATHENQLEAFGEEDYIRKQRELHGFDMSEGADSNGRLD